MKLIEKTYEQGMLILRMMPDVFERNQVLVFLYGEGMNETKHYKEIQDGFEIMISNEALHSKIVKVMIKNGNDICYFNRFRIPSKYQYHDIDIEEVLSMFINEPWNINSSVMIKDQEFNNKQIMFEAYNYLK